MSDLESNFKIDELFYSKTDFKGIIQSCNDVFTRVSEFAEEDLLKRPHNVIRHDDMPRSVFKLFWSFLKNKKPIAAYVKNKSKTGRYYWVFAMAFPMSDGYLSIRLKPTSGIFPLIQDLYQQILKEEEAGLSMDLGIEKLLEALQKLGFASYDDFMKQALLEELSSRDSILEGASVAHAEENILLQKNISEARSTANNCTRLAQTSYNQTRDLYQKAKELLKETKIISDTCQNVKFVTTNLTISSAKLGEAGRPLGVVSNNLKILTGEISTKSTNFEEIFNSFKNAAFEMYFCTAVSRFQIEMMGHLVNEVIKSSSSTSGLSERQETSLFASCDLLKELILENIKAVETTANHLKHSNKSLIYSIEDLSKVTAGMDVIRVIGKIEMSRIGGYTEALQSRLQEMENLTDLFKATLKTLEQESCKGINSCIQMLHPIRQISQSLQTMGASPQ